jgi:hypothetical protein
MFFLSLTVTGCGLINSNSNGSDNIIARFNLTDNTGQTNTTFALSQKFNMNFLLINATGKTVAYSTKKFPAINFEIKQGDSVIGKTVYVISILAVPSPTKFLPGDTLRGSCEAPLDMVNPGGVM